MKKRRKLVLNQVTVKNLGTEDLRNVAGGDTECNCSETLNVPTCYQTGLPNYSCAQPSDLCSQGCPVCTAEPYTCY